jgi:hypothetical protein
MCVRGGEAIPPPSSTGASNQQPVLHHAGVVSAQSLATGELCVAVSPISWQRNLNFCGSPRSSSESRRPLDVISVCTRPGQHVTDRIGPYQPQVQGGVRVGSEMEACVDPGPSLGNPPVLVFSLWLGGVLGGGPVAGQLSGTPCGPGWRIHGSVEDTKLSTNKQHTLSCRADPSNVASRSVPVLGSRGLSPSRSPALQLGPQGSLW